MMDPISVTTALAGIPGIFTTCVECYRYIQLGREFEDDFEVTWCKLEAAEVRLARWGVSMGIEGPETKLRGDGYNEDDIRKAYHWLGEIEKAFKSAIETSTRYGKTAKPEKLHLLDTDAQLRKGSHSLRVLHNRMREVVDQRVKPRKRDRISWALYRKGAFENLIEIISDITNNLVELFTGTVEAQEQLCRNEVRDLDIKCLTLLDKAIGNDDEILKAILRDEVQKRPNFYSDIEVRDYFIGHFGDNVAPGESSRSGVYTHIKGSGSAVAHFGNTMGNFQGKTIYDSKQKEAVKVEEGEQVKADRPNESDKD